ncbi:MAG: BTAD domain-containing putative transcriptional regulator [Ilumatobacteraceae bacterium]
MVDLHALVLGPIAVRHGPAPPHVLTGRMAALLGLLVAGHPDAQPAPYLIDALWSGRPTPSAPGGLRVMVNTLRRALRSASAGGSEAHELIGFEDGGYRLRVPSTSIDAWCFEDLMDGSRRQLEAGEAVAALSTIDDALALWRGRAYGTHTDVEPLAIAATRLELLRLDAEDHHVEVVLAVGDTRRAATLAEALALAEPLREQRWSRLMLALYRSGRQAEALRAFQRARAVLVDELGIEPGAELRAMEHAVLMQDADLESSSTSAATDPVDVGRFVRALRATTSRLPAPVTPLVGRVREVDLVHELLTDRRFVTVIGPGGAGKSRLALAVAAVRRTVRPDRTDVVYVALAAETGGSMVTAVADQLHVGTRVDEDLVSTLIAHLRGGRALVVLDNCEHVAEEAGRLVHALITGCPEIEILVTSRTALGIEGETRVVLGALSDDDARTLLFERAAAAIGRSPEPSVVPDGLVDRLLDRLDRLPLAIELAASQLDTMSWGELDAAVAGSRGIIRSARRTDERHRDLAATVEWSYDLLDDRTQRFFDGLGIMSGSFLAADVAAVQGVAPEVAAQSLRELAACSMVVARPGASVTRFELLETMRWFAGQRLAGRETDLRAAHADHYTALVGELDVALRGPDEAAAMARFSEALDDVRAVFRRAVESADVDRASAIATGVWRYGMNRLHDDLLGFAEEVIAMPGGRQHPRCSELLGVAGHKAWLRSDAVTAERYAVEGLALSRPELGWSVPMAVGTVVNVAGYQGDFGRALEAYLTLLEWARAQDDPFWLAGCHVIATIAASVADLPDVARDELQRALEQAERIENPSTHAWTGYAAGLVAIEDDVELAVATFEHSAAIARSVANGWLLGMNLSGLATALRHGGRPQATRVVLRELLVLWHRGNKLSQLRHALMEAALVLADDDRDGARLALALADRVSLGYPPLPSDRPLVDALRTSLGSRQPWSGPFDDAIDEVVALIG